MALLGAKKSKSTKLKVADASKSETVVAEGAKEYLTRALLAPRVTEKATLYSERGIYVFLVPTNVTKHHVSAVVKALYGVSPKKVTMVRMRPQRYVARMRGRTGMKSGFKKAYVHLKKGETISIMV